MDIRLCEQCDLTLGLDDHERLWKLRPVNSVRRAQPVDAHADDTEIVITVPFPGVQPGDVDVQICGAVLQIVGRVARTRGLTCNVALPCRVDLSKIETVYGDGVLGVCVPTATSTAPAETVPHELAAVTA